jgi:voltage-gated potassium channel
MSSAVIRPHVLEFVDTAMHSENLDLLIEEVKIGLKAEFANKTLRDSGIKERSGCIILAIRDGDGEFTNNPPPGRTLRTGEIMIAMGSPDQLEKLLSMAGADQA